MNKEYTLASDIILLSGSGNPELAQKVGKELWTDVWNCVTRHDDGTAKIDIPINIRNRDVFIIQSTCPPYVDNHFMELFLMVSAAKRASAREITTIIPYFGYARSDKMDDDRGTIAVADIAKILESRKTSRLMTIDLHAKQSVGSVDIPWSDVYASYILLPEIRKLDLDFENVVIASPDEGGMKRAKKYSQLLGLGTDVPNAVKTRDKKTGKNRTESINGDVKGKHVIFVDDILNTGGTLIDGAEVAMKEGALDVYAFTSHALFTDTPEDKAIDRFKDSCLSQVIVTDTLPQRPEILACDKVRVVSVAPLIARAIECMQSGESLSQTIYSNGN